MDTLALIEQGMAYSRTPPWLDTTTLYIVWWTKNDDSQISGWVVLPEIWLEIPG